MVDPSPHPIGGLAPAPHVEDQARIAHRVAPETGGRHAAFSQNVRGQEVLESRDEPVLSGTARDKPAK